MKGKVKDPGSALTHFIAMILACLAAVPAAYQGSQRTWNAARNSPYLFLSSA